MAPRSATDPAVPASGMADLFADGAVSAATAPETSAAGGTVWLSGPTDWAGFRRQARALVSAGVPPDAVRWQVRDAAEGDLFAGGADDVAMPAAVPPASGIPAAVLRVPASLVVLCETVVLHRDARRFGLMYRLLWRFTHEPGLRDDPLDADRIEAQHLAQAVRRDMHKMKAFVRFRTVHVPGEPLPLHVAWFEPEHHIVAAVAPFFARRFTAMRWAILTPEASVEWLPPLPHTGTAAYPAGAPAPSPAADASAEDLADSTDAATLPPAGALRFGPPARREDAPPADAGESLWLTYYAHIFNPARLKLAMMQKEMPRKYWHNLPESVLIQPLASAAGARTGHMVEQTARPVARRIPASSGASTASTGASAPTSSAPAEGPTTARHAPASTAERPHPPLDRLEDLKPATDRCRECPIGAYATQSVVGEGPRRARLLVVGEQPGDHEDIRGRPFVGPAGQLFDRAIGELGWSRQQLFVTNAVKHFKFELRGQRRIHKTPGQLEVAACRHWLDDELRLVQPEAILALGATAARAVLGRPVAVMKERGQWHNDPQGRPVLVTLHPSALLRGDPAQHAEAYAEWLRDLSLAAEFLQPRDGADT